MNSFMGEREIVEFLIELVRAQSVNPPADTAECAKVVLGKLKKENIDAEIVEGKEGLCNVVARLRGNRNGKVLLMNGHLDVVPPGDGWTVDPFGGEVLNGKIYGRGTSDMKSGVASMIAAMIAVKRSGVSFNGEIVFMGVADEETGSEFGTQYLLEKNIGKNADFAIVSEPTSLKVALGNRGLRWIDISVRGKACHAGRPHLGVNAIQYGARLIEGIHSMEFRTRNDLFEIPTPSISVTMIGGGTKANIIPERCDLTVDRRMVPGETTDTVMEELKRIIDPITVGKEELQIEAKVRPIYWDPYLIQEDEPIVHATIESVKRVTGTKPKILGKAGCTDGSHIFHLGRIPTVIFGPGNETLAHQVDECVEIRNLVLATEIFVSIFKELLGNA